MRKILPVLLLCFFCCGCSFITPMQSTAEDAAVVIAQPTDDTVGGYRLENAAEPQTGSTTVQKSSAGSASATANAYTGDYYANTGSMKFHRSTCSAVKRMKEENLYVTADRSVLIAGGYEPCKLCNP